MTNGALIERLRTRFAEALDAQDLAPSIEGSVLATFDRAALRTIVEAHEPPVPELTPQQRGGQTRKANRLKREKEQAREALANGHSSTAEALRFPGGPVGGA